MGRKRTKKSQEDFEQEDIILDVGVDAVEKYFFSRVDIEGQEFAPQFRSRIRSVVKSCGVAAVLEAVRDAVDRFGVDGLEKIVPFAICRANPKTKANYIIGIIRNKLEVESIDQSWTAVIKNVVSDIVDRDGGDGEAIDYVIEQLKRLDPLSVGDSVVYLMYYGRFYFDNRYTWADNVAQILADVEELAQFHGAELTYR
jgi:hypothetical protein